MKQRAIYATRRTTSSRTLIEKIGHLLCDNNFWYGAIGQLLWSWAGYGEALPVGRPAYFVTKSFVKGNQGFLDNGTRSASTELFDAQANEATKEAL